MSGIPSVLSDSEHKHQNLRFQLYPDLKLDPFVLPEDGLDLEIDSDGGDEGRRERVVGVSLKMVMGSYYINIILSKTFRTQSNQCLIKLLACYYLLS